MDQQILPPQVQGSALPMPDYDEKFFAALGYFGFLFLLSLIAKPKSAFCKFHAKQSLVLFGVTLLSFIVLYLSRFLGSILTLVLFAVYVLAIYRSYRGDWWSIPLVSKWAGKVDVQKMYQTAGLAVSNLSGLKEVAGNLADKAGQMAEKVTSQATGSDQISEAPETPAAPEVPAEQKPTDTPSSPQK